MRVRCLFRAFCLCVLLSGGLTPAAHAHLLRTDIINNHFELDLPHGDHGAVYFLKDKSMVMMPSYTNQSIVHNCWGKWRFDEDRQKLQITGAKRCKVLNGDYHVHRQRQSIALRDGNKKIVLTFFHQR